MSEASTQQVNPTLGWLGFVIGAAALLIAMAMFWSGPFGVAPEPVAEPSLLERASDAARSLVGNAPAEPEVAAVPVEPPFDIDGFLRSAVPILAGLAVILGLGGFARGEAKRPAFSAVTLGGGTILFQLVTGLILILICLMLVGTLSKSGDGVGDIFTGILEVITGFFSAIGDFFANLFGGFGS